MVYQMHVVVISDGPKFRHPFTSGVSVLYYTAGDYCHEETHLDIPFKLEIAVLCACTEENITTVIQGCTQPSGKGGGRRGGEEGGGGGGWGVWFQLVTHHSCTLLCCKYAAFSLVGNGSSLEQR